MKTPQTQSIFVTPHADRRARQRGVSRQSIELLLDYSDIILNAGNHCETWRLSHEAVSELRLGGVPSAVIARTRRLALVVADGCRIATILHMHEGRRGRCHRRQMPTRAAQAN